MSAITLLVWDDRMEEFEVSRPTAEDIEARLAALDGAERTLVTIIRGDAHFAAGGSAADGLVVYCTFDNEQFWQLMSDGDPGSQVSLHAGGQTALFPADRVSTLTAAVSAAIDFLERGERSTDLRWARQ